jgi:hypothetical protein
VRLGPQALRVAKQRAGAAAGQQRRAVAARAAGAGLRRLPQHALQLRELTVQALHLLLLLGQRGVLL